MRFKKLYKTTTAKSTLIKSVYLIAIVYTATNLGREYLGLPGTLYQLIFAATVLLAFLYTFKWPLDTKVVSQILLLSPLIFLNVYNSIDSFNSGLYWLFWLMFFIAMVKVALSITEGHFKQLLHHTPYILLSTSIILYLILFPYLNNSLSTKNSLGIISGATFISAFSIEKEWRKWGVVLISLWILNASDSRSSFAFALAIVGIYELLNLKLRYVGIYISIILGLLVFSNNIFLFVEEKMLKKEYFSDNLAQAIESARTEREQLAKEGWKLFKDRPLIGFGLKTDYHKGRLSIVNGIYTGVHNGYLETLIETGLLISSYIGLIVLLILNRIRLNFLSNRNSIWSFFLLFGFLRAYGESYLFFNIGNIFSIIFLFLCIMMTLRPNLLLKDSNTRVKKRRLPQS